MISSIQNLRQLVDSSEQCKLVVQPCSHARGADQTLVREIDIEHVSEPADQEEDFLTGLNEAYGIQEQLFEFLTNFKSIELFKHRDSGTVGYYLASPDEWGQLEKDFNLWVDELDENEKAELLPDWITECLLIGEKPGTGNYFLFVYAGKNKGCVYEFEHDGFEFILKGKDFFEFLDRLCTLSDDLLEDLSAHVRYFFDDSDEQWLPIRYIK